MSKPSRQPKADISIHGLVSKLFKKEYIKMLGTVLITFRKQEKTLPTAIYIRYMVTMVVYGYYEAF